MNHTNYTSLSTRTIHHICLHPCWHLPHTLALDIHGAEHPLLDPQPIASTTTTLGGGNPDQKTRENEFTIARCANSSTFTSKCAVVLSMGWKWRTRMRSSQVNYSRLGVAAWSQALTAPYGRGEHTYRKLGPCELERNRTEQNRTEQNRTEQNRNTSEIETRKH